MAAYYLTEANQLTEGDHQSEANHPAEANPPMEVKLYNTLTRKIEPLRPHDPGTVTLYACGKTVYDRAHIGNLRKYVVDDVLVKTLRYAGYAVRHVTNVTDVGHLTSDADEGEDKMEKGARREGLGVLEIACRYEAMFFEDCRHLNVAAPDKICRATEHVDDMIALITRLEMGGFTYTVDGNVYFDISRFPDYGVLTGQSQESLRAGARIDIDPRKRNPLDFVLWFTQSKFSQHALQWDSPWGRGYPGWHIECSAMALKELGEHLDIHTGGVDHIPVHHTNEIAQSEAALGHRWVGHWVHSDFLVTDGEKMSSSTGEFLSLDRLTHFGAHPLDFRFMCLNTRYRKQLSFSEETLSDAKRAHRKLRRRIALVADAAACPMDNRMTDTGKMNDEADGILSAEDTVRAAEAFSSRFLSAMLDDLNTPNALSVLHEMLRDETLPPTEKIHWVAEFDRILSLDLLTEMEIPDERKTTLLSDSVCLPDTDAIETLLRQRDEARLARNWQEADRIRQGLSDQGIEIMDSPQGANWQWKTRA